MLIDRNILSPLVKVSPLCVVMKEFDTLTRVPNTFLKMQTVQALI